MMTTVVAGKPNGRQCRLLKITEYLKKKPGVTDEQFHAHWNGQHVNIAMESELFRKKVRKYNQVSPSLGYHLHLLKNNRSITSDRRTELLQQN